METHLFFVGHIFRAFLVASGSAVAMAASKIAWTSLSDLTMVAISVRWLVQFLNSPGSISDI